MTARRTAWILALILLISFALRIYQLGKESFWIDEMNTVELARLPLSEVSAQIMDHMPLHFYLIHFQFKLFRESEFSARFPSVWIGVVAVFLVFLAGKRYFDRETGLLAALLVGVSLFHVHYSQEARPYALLSLAAIGSMLAYTRLKEKPTPFSFALYFVATITLMYTHAFGLFLIAVQNLDYIWRWLGKKSRPNLKLTHWFVLQAAMALAFFPWAAVLAEHLSSREARTIDRPPPPLTKLIGPFIAYSGSLVQFLIYGALAGVAVLLRRGKENAFLLLWLIVPLVLPFVISYLYMPIHITRYMIGSSFPFYLLAAAGIRCIPRPRLVQSAIVIVLLLAAWNIREYSRATNKEPWREVAAHVDGLAREGDVLFVHVPFVQGVFDYYSSASGGLPRLRYPAMSEGVDRTDLDSLRLGIGPFDRVWVVKSYSEDEDNKIREIVSSGRRIEYDRSWHIKNVATGKRVSIEAYLASRVEPASGTTER